MFASHQSMKNDFEISCLELDLMVEIAATCSGVLGARMTGFGFGGSTVNLVKKQNPEEFSEKIRKIYFDQTNIKPTILTSSACEGASEYYYAF